MIFVDVVERVSFLTYEFKQIFLDVATLQLQVQRSRVTLLASASVGMAPLSVLPSAKC